MEGAELNSVDGQQVEAAGHLSPLTINTLTDFTEEPSQLVLVGALTSISPLLQQ